ncbi:MAG: hypothetical protein OXF02_04155 [Simkaniaceae bacterium]|nr:hypothetical protein [Simkaniaceae bacterium]
MACSLAHALFAVATTPDQDRALSARKVFERFLRGGYEDFLHGIHERYERESRMQRCHKLLEERTKSSTNEPDLSTKAVLLRESEERELVEVCLSAPDSPFARRVMDMIFYTPGRQEKEGLDYLAGLGRRARGAGRTPAENALIDIDTEFWVKSIVLERMAVEKEMDGSTYGARHAALQFEKLRRMHVIVDRSDADPGVRRRIFALWKAYPKMYVAGATRRMLHDFVTGKAIPGDGTEEKIRAIVVKYHKLRTASEGGGKGCIVERIEPSGGKDG